MQSRSLQQGSSQAFRTSVSMAFMQPYIIRLGTGRCADYPGTHSEASTTGDDLFPTDAVAAAYTCTCCHLSSNTLASVGRNACCAGTHAVALGMLIFAASNADIWPPFMQVFHAQLDVRRSRRFPVSVPMHNLRTILATSDAEGLADRVSRALQDRLARAQRNMWRHGSWQDLPPDASISICRADGATIRAALRPQAVVPRLVHHLQQAGWPPAKHQPKPAGRTGPAAHNSACTGDVSTVRDVLYAQRSLSSGGGCVSGSDCLVSECLPPGLVDVMHLCQQRMGLLRSQQLQQLQHLRKPSQPVQPGAKAGCVKGAAGWRPNMVALHTVLLKLPGDTAIRSVQLF